MTEYIKFQMEVEKCERLLEVYRIYEKMRSPDVFENKYFKTLFDEIERAFKERFSHGNK